MGVFNRHSRDDSNSNKSVEGGDISKITKEERHNLKVRTASVHDPILVAVQEAQPFEQAADTFQSNINRQSYLPSGQMKDVFGQPITQPDISNPTRSRDERPMDTIRSFEYAISGDPTWSQQLETPQLGFQVRPGFQTFAGRAPANGYQNQNGMTQDVYQNSYQQQGVYQAPVSSGNTEEKKKKKRGFFGRKKKD